MFLKDADLLKCISSTEAELIFTKIIGMINDKRLTFDNEVKLSKTEGFYLFFFQI